MVQSQVQGSGQPCRALSPGAEIESALQEMEVQTQQLHMCSPHCSPGEKRRIMSIYSATRLLFCFCFFFKQYYRRKYSSKKIMFEFQFPYQPSKEVDKTGQIGAQLRQLCNNDVNLFTFSNKRLYTCRSRKCASQQ